MQVKRRETFGVRKPCLRLCCPQPYCGRFAREARLRPLKAGERLPHSNSEEKEQEQCSLVFYSPVSAVRRPRTGRLWSRSPSRGVPRLPQLLLPPAARRVSTLPNRSTTSAKSNRASR